MNYNSKFVIKKLLVAKSPFTKYFETGNNVFKLNPYGIETVCSLIK